MCSMKRFTFNYVTACVLTVSLLIGGLLPASCLAGDEPLNQRKTDTGEITPASFIYGHVTHQEGRYIIGPGDVIEIHIKDLSQYDQKFTVTPDGYASIHPLGEYRIAGIDVKGLESFLEEKFKYYLLQPEITVSINEMRPVNIYVVGEVQRPGTYQFIRNGINSTDRQDQKTVKIETTLTNILAQAGGVLATADIENIEIVHASTQQRETFNLLRLLKSGEGVDMILMPEDKLIIHSAKNHMDPETFKLVSRSTYFKNKFPIVVLGSVNNQGEVLLDPNNNTLNAAIGLAGGFQIGAKRGTILLQRPDMSGKYHKMRIDREAEQVALEPGDVIFVSDGNIKKMQRFLGLVSGVTSNLFYGATTTRNLQDFILRLER